jgi:hypothetical protein
MSARSFEVSPVGLPQTAILARQTARTLAARDLDAVLFVLELGEPPILDAGGSGFVIGPDPPAGVGAYAHEWMKVYLMRQAKMPPGHT